jgi:MFS family permease
MSGVRGLLPDLPRSAWVVLAGDAFSAVGSGLTLPFLIVYLHEVRGISLGVAGLILATVAAASVLGNLAAGIGSDRIGARATLVAGLAVSAAGSVAMIAVHDAWQGFAAAAALGLGAAVVWPAQDALLATLVRPEQRSAVFSTRHMTLNAGLGTGALIAALLVDIHRPGTFTLLYALDGLTFLAVVPLVLMSVPKPAREAAPPAASGGYRQVLADRRMLGVLVLSTALVTLSYGQFHSAFPAWATRPGGVSPSALSFAFAANAVTVVAVQLPVMHLLRGRRRTTGAALACAGFGLTWLLTLVVGGLSSDVAATIGFASAMVVFAISETALAPTLPALVNDLAPDELRGRYNGASTLAWTTGFLLGPALSGAALSSPLGGGWFVVLVALAAATAAGALAFGRTLPAAIDTIVTTS